MGWGSLISTVGNIVGNLIDSITIEDGVVYYAFPYSRKALGDETCSAAFAKDGGKYFLFNSSVDSSAAVNMSFPCRGDMGAETIQLPGRSQYDVTEYFKYYAQNDHTEFELSAGDLAMQDGNETSAVVSASGYNIPVGGMARNIGASMDVQVTDKEITITPKIGRIQAVTLLTVNGASDSAVKILNETAQNSDAITIALPEPLKSDMVDISVMAQVTDASAGCGALFKPEGIKATDDETFERVVKAKRLNW